MTYSRRQFLSLAALGAVASATGMGAWAQGARDKRVVIIGGGFAGVTCAKYLRRADPSMGVTLIERQVAYATPPGSNLVVVGLRGTRDLTVAYDRLRRNHGVDVVHGNVVAIDAGTRKVALEDGRSLGYDRLVVAPGIEFDERALEGYDERAAALMPHAWSGGTQTEVLHGQLTRMRDGETVIITVPPEPLRCPPGPFERASLIAHYLKANKPRSKVLILDANDSFPAKDAFLEAWSELYPGMIEWVPGSRGGKVTHVDARSMTVFAGGQAHRGAVVNVIPPQRAGAIALKAGLADASGWCPVIPSSFESTRQPGIHVIGDSCIAGKLPKSAAAANSQAKVCAEAIAHLLAGKPVGEPSFVNACYALVSPTYAVSIAGVYGLTAQGIAPLPGAFGVTPLNASAKYHRKEARDAEAWYANIVADSFA